MLDMDTNTTGLSDESALRDPPNLQGNWVSAAVLCTRDNFKEYFKSPAGQVPWQYDRVRHRMII